jgi:hypothetical protein
MMIRNVVAMGLVGAGEKMREEKKAAPYVIYMYRYRKVMEWFSIIYLFMY